MNVSEFVTNLVIPEPEEYNQLADKFDSRQLNNAQINVGCLCAFAEDLTVQNKEDVVHSILLAQLAANKKCKRFEDPINWYKSYIEILGGIGWILPSFDSSEFKPKSPINWEEIVLNSIGSGDTRTLAESAIDAAKSLKSNSKGMEIWRENSSSDCKTNFQVMTVMLVNGDVVAFMSGIHFQSPNYQDKFLSWTTNISISAYKLEFNKEVYSKIRQKVIDKLKKVKMTNMVADIPL